MEFVLNDSSVFIPWWGAVLFSFFISFGITYVSIPTILTVSHRLGLYENKDSRKSHRGNIPTLGGVAIFAGVVISGSLLSFHGSGLNIQYILASLVILFFTGIKDDLLVLDPKKKLIAELIAIIIVVVLGDFRITSFHGLVNIQEISYLSSVLFTTFVFVVIINGFNLIDGINGLSSGVAILVSITFGVWFILEGDYHFAAIPFLLTGSLIAFFRFNVFSKKNRIFLGDTGALSIGLIIAVIAVRFLESDYAWIPETADSAPAITFGVLIVPLFDTLRVFILRVFEGESPFNADRKHIHHRLLDLGYSHFRSSMMIMGANLLFIIIVILFRDLGNLKLIFITLVLATILSYIPMHMLYKRTGSIPIKFLEISRDDEDESSQKGDYSKKNTG